MKTLAFLLPLFLALSCATTPPAGSPCDAGMAYCTSSTSALQCQDGKLVAFTCLGPKGCTKGPAVAGGYPVRCDQSATGNAAGTPCAPEYAGIGHCSPDAGAIVQCRSGSWVALACPQGTQCKDDGGVGCR
jgi:hypothetical protein